MFFLSDLSLPLTSYLDQSKNPRFSTHSTEVWSFPNGSRAWATYSAKKVHPKVMSFDRLIKCYMLVCFSLLWQNTWGKVRYKEKIYLAPSSEDPRTWHQFCSALVGASWQRASQWWECMSKRSHGKKGNQRPRKSQSCSFTRTHSLRTKFYKSTTNPFGRWYRQWPNHLPVGPTSSRLHHL